MTCARWGAMVAALALCAPVDAAGRDFAVSSFDGTRIEAHFFPAPNTLAGARVPTVLYGPSWGNAGATDEDGPTQEADGPIGIGTLRRAGYNVLTWDPRGFGASGGEAQLDSAHHEARDVQALLDALAQFPEAALDAPGDPRAGMTGSSYGGGIQWTTAAIDRRVDAITPTVAWHSLVSSIYKAEVFKAGWGSIICGTGAAEGVSTGLVNPDGVQAGSMDRHVYSICQSGLTSGKIGDADRDWLAERGPGTTWTGLVRTPALVLHGSADTLFTLAEAIANFRILRSNGVPARMTWFCGGHGTCRTPRGLNHVETSILRWFGRHLKGESLLGTGPGFDWIDQHGVWHQASDYPLAPDGQVTASGSGMLQLVPGDAASSGTAISATPAANGVEVGVPPPARSSDLVGPPRLELEYNGTGTSGAAHAYAQIVDVERDSVVGGQVTPLPLTLDAGRHTLSLDLEPVAYVLTPASRLRLQIVSATNVYGSQRVGGTVELTAISLTLPFGRSAPGSGPREQTCRPTFAPRAVTRRSDGSVRMVPRVRCGRRRLRKQVTISDGRHLWTRRTGMATVLRVRPRAARLAVRFRHAGRRHRVRVPISP
jgi:ABC-2 type transport system ATP-binding protein